MFYFSQRSIDNLGGVSPALVLVAGRALALSSVDFAITEGLRTIDRQRELFEAGASQTMNSQHLTGHAVDVAAYVGGRISWDWPLYELIAAAFKDAAEQLRIAIEWGGDWLTFKDGPHFQLPRNPQ